jgi:hypothetical protein
VLCIIQRAAQGRAEGVKMAAELLVMLEARLLAS